MKQKVVNIITEILATLLGIFYRKPKHTITLLFNTHLWKQNSYYPEKRQKSSIRIVFDQIVQIWRYGAPNEFYFLYGLDVKHDDDYKSYIHYAPFMKRRDELNLKSTHNCTCILRNKFYFGIFASGIGVNTPRNIVYVQNGKVFLIKEKCFISLEAFVARHNHNSFFCKVLDGECGNGVFKLEIEGQQILHNGESVSLDYLRSKIANAVYIFQESIQQHSKMSAIYDKSINSIRLVSVRDVKDGEIVVLPSILRIGANGSIVDNTSQGGIAVGFDPATGRLNEYGFFKPEFGLRADTHPNSGIKFADFTIPFIKEAVEQAKYFHSFLDLHSIGWDIAIGEDGPIFIEGNDNWEINGPQSCNRGLAKEFYNLFYK